MRLQIIALQTRLLLFFLMHLPLFCLGQVAGNIQYTIRDGLPGSTIYSMDMDKSGRILFGTDQGVSIFNGMDFRNISRKDGLLENEVLLLFNDSKDRTWITTFGNKMYCYKDGKLSVAFEDSTGLLSHSKFITEDSKGNIWTVGRNILKFSKGSFQKIQQVNDYQNMYFYEKENKWFFISVRGTTEVDAQLKSKFSQNTLKRYYQGSYKWKGDIYFYYQGGIDQYEEYPNNIFLIKKKTNSTTYINRVKVDEDDNLWILTKGDGAFRIDGATGDTTRFIPGGSVSDVLIDDEKNIWLSTLGEGVFKFYFPFVKWYLKDRNINSDHFISVASDGSNGILAGENNGNVYYFRGDTIKTFRYTSPQTSNRILDLVGVDEKYFLAATDEGIIKYDFETGNSFKMIDSLKTFKFIKKTSQGTFLAGNYKYGLELGALPEFKLLNVWDKRTVGMEEYAPGKFFLASIDGLYEIQSGNPQVSPVGFLPGNERVNAILKDSSGVLWMATYNSGVYVYQDKKLIHLSDSTGLAGNSCKHIFVDTNGDVYVSTDKGISRLRTTNNIKGKFQITNFTTENGLPSNETNQCVVVDKKLWVATGKGLAAIDMNYQTRSIIPVVVINSITTSQDVFHPKDAIGIQYPVKYLDLKFEGISISGGKNIAFRYQVKGLDKGWNETKTTSIRYASIPPGNYTFQIVAFNEETMMESKVAELQFTVIAPWWRSVIFVVLMVLAMAGLLWQVFRWRLRKLQGRAEIRNRMLAAEIKSIRSQMDPHFIFNALNSIQGYVLKNEKVLANQYLTSFSRLMRMVLENSNRNFVTIQEEMEFLELYLKLEQLRLNNKFSYRIAYDKSINPELDEIPAMVLQPLVENAVIHGIGPKKSDGQILVKFESQSDKIFCIVEDDGEGFFNLADKNQTNQNTIHKSFGFKAIEERIKLLNTIGLFHIKFKVSASIYLDPGKGTRVEIEIEDKTN